MVEPEKMETVHVFVVPEGKLPPKPDYAGTAIAILCSIVFAGILGLILFSPKTEPEVSFSTTIAGYNVPPVSQSITLLIHATGRGHIAATYATGRMSFYNGQTYTQVIPVGTILQGTDGVAVITDQEAVIPPAAQTTPPTYGVVSVPAHASVAGTNGNIAAGDINMPCCVTSVIAQNPYNFTGGTNARDYTYLTTQDVTYAVADTIQRLEEQTKARFTAKIVLEPTCHTTHTVTPAIGSETTTAQLTLSATCNAVSYSPMLAKQRIEDAGKQYGRLANIQFTIVSIRQKKGAITISVYVTAIVVPVVKVLIR
ncbi:MAG TPA: baseplate J/gp47 family protein [Ktedonobacteraceae bacterium]|nr:baseplate J/gp47 family protein [Ktedonobacteraceae bacterium]